MTQIHAYLTFDGDCRQAMTFYRDCFGGELKMQTVEEACVKSMSLTGDEKKILHASLINDGLVLLGADVSYSGGLVRGNAISLSLRCSSAHEAEILFDKLSIGGQVAHPLRDFIAGTMGALTDKFGKDWLLYYEKKC